MKFVAMALVILFLVAVYCAYGIVSETELAKDSQVVKGLHDEHAPVTVGHQP